MQARGRPLACMLDVFVTSSSVAVKSVLVVAGGFKRAEPELPEQVRFRCGVPRLLMCVVCRTYSCAPCVTSTHPRSCSRTRYGAQ